MKKFDFDLNKFELVNCNKDNLNIDVEKEIIEISTTPYTDLWQRTYYHFRNDNATMILFEIKDKYFSFSFKTIFKDAHHRFDQSGVILYLDSGNWIKGSIEYENNEFQHLGSVVTNNGFSDWATQDINPNIKEIYYRLSRRDDDFKVEYSFDNKVFHQMRICHLHNVKDKVRVGVYACSPEESSFKAIFKEFKLEECKWQAHDGQEPDY